MIGLWYYLRSNDIFIWFYRSLFIIMTESWKGNAIDLFPLFTKSKSFYGSRAAFLASTMNYLPLL